MSNTLREYRQKTVQQLMASAQGMSLLAKSMTQPLRNYQDYSSIGRNAFLVETLQQGQDPLIDTDVGGGDLAYIVTELGQDVSKIVNPETVRIPTLEVASNPKVSYSQIASRKFDLKARVQQKAQSEIFRKEDAVIFQTLMAAALHKYRKLNFQSQDLVKPTFFGNGEEVTVAGDPVNAPIVIEEGKFTIDAINAAMSNIERHGGLKCTNLFMNAKNVQVLRRMNSVDKGFFVDFDTSKEIMRNGFIATVFGLNVFTTPELPEDVILVTAEPEFTGRIVERIPLTVVPYDEPANRMYALSIFQETGYFCHNPRAVAAIQLTK